MKFRLKIEMVDFFGAGRVPHRGMTERLIVQPGSIFELLPMKNGTYLYCYDVDANIYALGSYIDKLLPYEKEWLDLYFEPYTVVDYNQYWAKLNEI